MTGTGPGGRIVEDDVMKVAAPTTQTLPDDTDQPLSQMRKAIARSTVQSQSPGTAFLSDG